MTIRRYVAPGKLMIAGEYSVLGPHGEALAIAVEPGLAVTATPTARWELARADSDVTWAEGELVPAELRFAHAALTEALGRCRPAPHRLETDVLGGTGTGAKKPGVGGSASAAVAITGAVFDLAGREADADRITLSAFEAHLSAQNGRGSGYDVATVAHGGLVLWRPARVAGGVGQREAVRLAWPGGLQTLAGYTGRSADTRELIARMEARTRRDPLQAARDLMVLGTAVGKLVDAFSHGELGGIRRELGRAHDALVGWDDTLGLGVITPEVSEMLGLAHSCGAAAKVSGAGGGDSVLAFGTLDELARVAEAWSAAGFTPLELSRAEQGFHRVI